MIASMTGFGRGRAEQGAWEFTAEIKSLNNRYLDINIKLPRSLSCLEGDLRRIIQGNLSRGRIDLYLSFVNAGQDAVEVEFNQTLATAYMGCLNRMAESFHIKNDLSLSTFINFPDIITVRKNEEDIDYLKPIVTRAVQQAIDDLKKMKTAEGSKLKADIFDRVDLVADILDKIEQHAPLVVEEYRLRLKDRLKELLQSTEIDETKFNSEVVYFAERSDVAEEIVRLKSHIIQLRQIMSAKGSIGRKLDFLIQEFNREINTIGSKVGNLMIINWVLDIKSEVEKIREQIQNIE